MTEFTPLPEINANTMFGSYSMQQPTNLSNADFNSLASYNQNTLDMDPSKFNLWGQGGANIAAALQGFGSLGNAYAAYQQYQLGKQQLNQNRDAFNRNLNNQALITNAEIQDRALRRAAQREDLAGDFDAIKAAADAVYQKRKISGEPV